MKTLLKRWARWILREEIADYENQATSQSQSLKATIRGSLDLRKEVDQLRAQLEEYVRQADAQEQAHQETKGKLGELARFVTRMNQPSVVLEHNDVSKVIWPPAN
jgi:uncharacterized coiled-coil DUF342 family protein